MQRVDLHALRPIDPAVARDVDLRRWREGFGDVPAIADLPDRQAVACVGVVSAIRLLPRKGLEVVVEDGSGRLVASFSGRTSLRGVELGGGVRLSGTVSSDADGLRRLRNPAVSPVRGPY